ncbi:hypothetical protein DO70_4724 [Burkholderia pseudomallei]|nr:hypothetical protein DO70_4724 [Burkholderia pseudomallei]
MFAHMRAVAYSARTASASGACGVATGCGVAGAPRGDVGTKRTGGVCFGDMGDMSDIGYVGANARSAADAKPAGSNGNAGAVVRASDEAADA